MRESQPAYRWVIVTVSALMLAFSAGVMVSGISVFFTPLHDEFGWQRGSVAFINFAGLIGAAFGGIVMGRVADCIPTRRICLFGAVVFALCLLAAARAEALWQFYLLFFLAGFFGASSFLVPLVANVGKWFTSGAGLALGIATGGQALGQGGVPFGTAFLIAGWGWRGALTTLGVIALVVLIPLALLIRQPPRQSSRQSAATAAGVPVEEDRSPVPLGANAVVAWLGVAVVFCCICMSVPLMHLVPLIEDRGISLEEAGGVLFVMLISGVFGRIAFGRLADLTGAIKAYLIASLWQTALVMGFLQFESVGGFYAFAVVYGFGYAGVMTGILVCVNVLTPLSRRAFSLGIVSFFGFVGHGLGGYQGGFFFDLTGDYALSYAIAALAGAVNLVIVGSLYLTIARRKAALAYAG